MNFDDPADGGERVFMAHSRSIKNLRLRARFPQAERPISPRESSNSQSALQNSARENA
jgi:hypothetical protein